jgi:Carboxypeptidase regulatory-like domain/TonB dependent receptor
MKPIRTKPFIRLEFVSQPRVGTQIFAGFLFSRPRFASFIGELRNSAEKTAKPARKLCNWPLPFLHSKFLSGFIPLALILMLAAVGIYAQRSTGELRGQVMDEFGGLIVEANVTLTDAGGFVKTIRTNSEGSYLFSGLAPGRYRVRVEARDFNAPEDASVEVKPGGSTTLNLKLSVALEKQEVTIGLETNLSTASENNAGAVVLGSTELEALPDDPDDLSAALQALAGPSAGPDGGQIFVDGFTDGRIPPKSSIREIRINSNPFSAEYSRLGYGRIEIFTRPGTDNFHGQASLNFSNQSLNSRNPFASSREPYRFRLYGGSLSGPVIAKRASFFLDFERRDINDNSIISATILDSSLNVMPLGIAVVTPQHRTTFSPRFDYQLNQQNTLVARYTYLHQSQQNAGVGNFSLLSRAYSTSSTDQSLQLTETAVLSQRVVNETRFQYSRRNYQQRGDDSQPVINVLDAFIGGGASVGLASTDEDRFELQNYTTFVLGRQTFKAGARLRHVSITDILPSNFGGTYTFAGGVAPLLDASNQIVFERDGQTGNLVPTLTQISSLERYRRQLLFERQGFTPEEIRARGGGATQFSIAGGNAQARAKQTELGLFIQDEWTLRPNLTLSLGLRFDTQSNVNRGFYLAPRIAFAYAPGVAAGGRTKTVIRGGFGIFFDRFNESLLLQANHFNAGNLQQFITTNPEILGLFPAVPSLALLENSAATRTSVQVAQNLQLPYMMQGAINVEQQLPLKFVFTATFLSARALHLLRSRNINAPLPGTFLPDQPDSSVRPLGNARGDVFQYESSGRFNQNQLIISLRNPINSKMSIIATYLLNKAGSDTDGPDTFPANSYDLSNEYGRSDLDIRHRFSLTGVFSLKYGLSLNPFILAASGRPFNITTGRDANGDTLYTERPAFAADLNQPGVVLTRLGSFNPNPRPDEQLVPRNYGTSPSFFTVSLRLSKTWGFGGERVAGASSTSQQEKKAKDKKKPVGSSAAQASGGAGGVGVLPDSNRSSFFGKAPDNPYKLTLSIVARNILNRTNRGRSIGNLNSLLFGQSNFLAPPYGFGETFESNAANRRIEMQLRFTF